MKCVGLLKLLTISWLRIKALLVISSRANTPCSCWPSAGQLCIYKAEISMKYS